MCAWCRHTRGRFERTHGGVFESTHGGFQRATPYTPHLLSLLFGIGFVSFVVILRTVLMISIAFFVCWIMPLLVLRGMVLFIFWFKLLMILVSSGILIKLVGFGLVFLLFVCCLGPFSIFGMLFGRPGNIRSLLIFASVRGSGVVLGFDIYGSHQLLVSSHLRERDKMLLRAILSGGVWNGFLLSKVKKEEVPCRFCGAPDNDGHLFWDCTFPPFVELRSQPEFLSLMKEDRSHWPRCLLWHGWLPGLSSRTLGSPWAVASSDLASSCLENALGSYPVSAFSAWQPFWDHDDVDDMIDDVPDFPNIWTDGSREPIPHLDFEIAGAGAFVHSPAIIFDSCHWGHAHDLDAPHEGSSHIFSGIPGPIQSVQRAEYWGVILALQAYSGIHIGIDNMNVPSWCCISSCSWDSPDPPSAEERWRSACYHSFYASPSCA